MDSARQAAKTLRALLRLLFEARRKGAQSSSESKTTGPWGYESFVCRCKRCTFRALKRERSHGFFGAAAKAIVISGVTAVQ
jgi:hypothetical protein